MKSTIFKIATIATLAIALSACKAKNAEEQTLQNAAKVLSKISAGASIDSHRAALKALVSKPGVGSLSQETALNDDNLIHQLSALTKTYSFKEVSNIEILDQNVDYEGNEIQNTTALVSGYKSRMTRNGRAYDRTNTSFIRVSFRCETKAATAKRTCIIRGVSYPNSETSMF